MNAHVTLRSPIGRLSISAPPGYVLAGADWVQGAVLARVTVDADVTHCFACDAPQPRRYGRVDVGILDAPSGGVRARMLVARQRIECDWCHQFSREPLPGVAEGHRFTDRCAAWMTSQFAFCSNVAIGAVLGLTERSVRLFAAEMEVAGRRQPRAMPVAQCSSCLRLLDHAPGPINHLSPGVANGTTGNIGIICDDCETDPGARWIRPA